MKQWNIEYWSEPYKKESIESWLNQLPQEAFKIIIKLIKLLELYGKHLKLPYSRSLRHGLFELRDTAHGLRIYYCFQANHMMILLQAGNKASQEKDIAIARQRIVTLANTQHENIMTLKHIDDYIQTKLTNKEIAHIEKQAQREKRLLDSWQAHISEYIHDYMKENKISFHDLVRILNMSPAKVTQLQKGKAHLTLSSMAHIFATLGHDLHFNIQKNEWEK